jgi:hypothetical protein
MITKSRDKRLNTMLNYGRLVHLPDPSARSFESLAFGFVTGALRLSVRPSRLAAKLQDARLLERCKLWQTVKCAYRKMRFIAAFAETPL